jgi:hypothetical protein
MESSAATRLKGVKELASLLQSSYSYDDAVTMFVLLFVSTRAYLR